MSVKPTRELSNNDILKSIGLLGCWEIDYTINKVRAGGEVGPVFRVGKNVMREGVALDSLDKAYLPEELEIMKRVRSSLIGVGGHTRLSYWLRHMETEDLMFVESTAYVTLDRDGHLAHARGTLFNVSSLQKLTANGVPPGELDQLAGRLVDAARLARGLRLNSIENALKPAIQSVGRMLSRMTVNASSYN